MECIACAECIDACRPIMLKLKRPTDLVGYFYGEPGRPRRLARPAVLALAAGTLLALAATAAAAGSAARNTLDLTATASAAVAPSLSPDGSARNVFDVALENRAHQGVAVRLALALPPGVEGTLRPDAVELGPGEHKRVRVVVTARGGRGTLTRTSPLSLVFPERP
jgi:polyferredoxin